MSRAPLLLVVLDGWGQRQEREHNAIASDAPYFRELMEKYPHSSLSACGEEVGLPKGIMGNSEVGHMNLGAGRIINQDVSRIDKSIEDGSFFENGAFIEAIERVRREGKQLHLMGLLSNGGVHSSDHHLRQLLKMCADRGLASQQVCLHVMTDGRDTPPRSGLGFVSELEQAIESTGVGRIASIIGRYYAMDRDNRWDRVERAYRLFVGGLGERFDRAQDVMSASYAKDVTDEFVEPSVVGAPDQGRMSAGDAVICFNYRSDRMREIGMALGFQEFADFEREQVPLPELVTMTRYRADFPFAVAYAPNDLINLFPDLISRAGLTQKRIAETEKYAHVTFFFSGGREEPLPGEERILLPSPRVATYDLQPEMSAPGITDAILSEVAKGETDVFIINFANADMVGHTGIYDAACAAVRTIDTCLQRIVPAVKAKGGTVVITADHGNSEMLWDAKNDQPHTAHTLNPVPIVFCSDALVGAKMRERGILADVAPTLLQLLQLEPAEQMNGRSLLL
ncbi:MAG: 2,3-bisphosphoglycerate-independent phosphoglycerate mutase [Planctomycetota bacterium]|jgi:2,3-bisphosphoglycerate-independent phosphoglycerate mutase